MLSDNALRHALQRIADMDPDEQRADDLGRAAGIARQALGTAGAAPTNERLRAAIVKVLGGCSDMDCSEKEGIAQYVIEELSAATDGVEASAQPQENRDA
jgi:hypothetical protein